MGGAAPSQYEQPLCDGACHLNGSPSSLSGCNAHWGCSSCTSTASSPNMAAGMASHGRWSPLHLKHRPSSAGSGEWPPIKGESRGGKEGQRSPRLRNHLLRTRSAPPRGWRRGARPRPSQAGEAGVGLKTNRLQQYNIQYLMPDCLIVSSVWWAYFNFTIK